MRAVHPTSEVLEDAPFWWRAGIERIRQVWRVALHPKFRAEVRLLAPFIPNDKGCLDIGANHGRFGLELARAGRRVIAFEPLGYNLAILRPAAALHRRVRVLPVALGEHAGQASLYVPVGDDGRLRHGWGFVAADDAEACERGRGERLVRHDIRIQPLDDIDLSWLEAPVGFIKIDVERNEAAVLRGGRAVLERDRPTVLMEVGGEADGLEALAELASLGYLLYDLDLRDEGEWTPDAARIHEVLARMDKSHDILGWPSRSSAPPPFGAPFEGTRFGR